jgi:hypothetical protein
MPAGQGEEALNPFAQFKILEFPDGREFSSEFRKFPPFRGFTAPISPVTPVCCSPIPCPAWSREFFHPEQGTPRSEQGMKNSTEAGVGRRD